MIAIYFVKVSAIYPRVVISSLAKRLESLLFLIPYIFFGPLWPRDYYMSLQRSTTGVCHALLRFLTIGPACSAKISPTYPSCTMWAWVKYHVNSHSSEQDAQPIVFLISKQVVPHRTCGCTCCPVASTPKIQSLANSSNYIP
jgi:hypothetical protein